MAGHSKWANIKHRKAAQDAKRGKIFTKIIRELVVASKAGTQNPEDNPRLRAAVEKALAANMKRDTIDKAIARGAGVGEGDAYEEIIYEGYAPGGVAVLVECMTDNRNRTVGEVRHGFTKKGGNLGTDGSVAYLFNRLGFCTFSELCDEDSLLEASLELGAEDFLNNDDGSFTIVTEWESLIATKEQLVEKGFSVVDFEVVRKAELEVDIDFKTAENLLSLVDILEDLDDVQNVFTNAHIAENILIELSENG